jgi:general L-amino acid transport system permease protein
MSDVALGFFFPSDVLPGTAVRVIIAFTIFTAAYVAEIVRGGLQSVPRGQTEAAQAVGLSPVRVTGFIVLPQALRNVIPALVGQFISLFKDTTLVFIIGFLDVLTVADNVTKQPGFVGQGLFAESLVFAAALFWVGAYTLSRESQRLERRLGVGVR